MLTPNACAARWDTRMDGPVSGRRLTRGCATVVHGTWLT